jgi:DNA-binding NarL/FixJ family response regulator
MVNAMASVSERDAAALLEVVAELGRLDDALPFPPHFLGLLARLIETNSANYSVLDRPRERVIQHCFWCDGDGFVDGPSDDAGNPYWRLRDTHPVCSYRERTGDWTTPHSVSEFLSRREFRSTEIWDELYRSEEIDDWLDVGLPRHEGVTRVFIFVREQRDFGERERRLLGLLQPHLERRAAEVEARAAAVEAFAAVEEAGDNARDVVLASAAGAIEFASPRSRALLRSYFGVQNGSLPDVLLGASPVVARGERGRLTVRTVRIDTLRVLLLGEDDVRAEALTSRQREVLAGVAAGFTDAEIAERLGVAPATVGKHLEGIYARLDVHTRTAAAALYRR